MDLLKKIYKSEGGGRKQEKKRGVCKREGEKNKNHELLEMIVMPLQRTFIKT